MDIVLFDTATRQRLFPLTLTRAIADIRMGIFTVRERWEKISGMKSHVLTEPYMQPRYEAVETGEYLLIDATVLPSLELFTAILALEVNDALYDDGGLVAGKIHLTVPPVFGTEFLNSFSNRKSISPVKRLELPGNIFQYNEEALLFDYNLMTKKRVPSVINETVVVTKVAQIFIEEDATVEHSNINASAGPVYIGRNTRVMEGCLIRGPFALCEGATLKMGTKIYGATTIGPYCVAGGEIKNSVLTGYSNKAHDGYLGDSVIGEWCNLGAGTSNSNVKNTGSDVSVWSYPEKKYLAAGKKAGVIMGDYSRTSINTSINTGTVAGVCCNIFGEGLTPKFIPDFTWGTKELNRYEFEKAMKDIENWKRMKNKTFDEQDKVILKHIFEHYN